MSIDVDVSNLGVHDVLHVSDIQVGENIEILNDPDTVIATVGIVKEEPVAAPVVEVEGPAEPEVIGKGKKEDEERRREREGQEGVGALPIADCRLPIWSLAMDWHLDLAKSISRANDQSAIGNWQSAMYAFHRWSGKPGRRI